MKAAILVCALLTAGCATVGEELEEAKAAWQGATYEEVVRHWGAPARSTTLAEGRQVHTWVSQEGPSYGGFGPQVGVGVYGGSGVGSGVGIGVGFPFGSSRSPRGCERTLTFAGGVVIEQSWNGDPAYCRFFRR